VAYFEGEKFKKKSRAAFYNHLRQPGYPFFRTRGFPDQSLNWFGFFIIDIESALSITIKFFIIRNNYAIFFAMKLFLITSGYSMLFIFYLPDAGFYVCQKNVK